MSQEKRKFTGYIRVQTDTKSVKLDLSPAEIYGGEEGFFRVRIHRRWVSLPDKTPLFCDKARLAEIIASLVFDEDFAIPDETEPDIPYRSRVTVKYWGKDDLPHHEGCFTATPPIRAFDGKWYVGVMTYGAGFIFVPASDITVRRR